MIYPDWTCLKDGLPSPEDYDLDDCIYFFYEGDSRARRSWSWGIASFRGLSTGRKQLTYWAPIGSSVAEDELLATPQQCREAVTGEDTDLWKDKSCENRDWVPHISDWSYW